MYTKFFFEGTKYTLVRKRDYSSVYVYKSNGIYLKIGKKNAIQKNIIAHKKLLSYNFPVPKIIKEGKYKNLSYFIEKSIGSQHFGSKFTASYQKKNKILDRTFKQFLHISEIFAKAQLRTSSPNANFSDFLYTIHFNLIVKERSALSVKLKELKEKLKDDLDQIPYVVSHGDFNPHNLYIKGVIDSEEIYYAPFGYDLISNIVHIYFFPSDKTSELYRGYEFTSSQIEMYFKTIHEVAQESGINNIRKYLKSLIICRAIWSTVRQQHTPKYQKWIYPLFGKMLLLYLQDGDLLKFLVSYDPLSKSSY